MANSDRDKDDVRVFDGGEDGDEAEGSHLPVVIIIAILVLAAFGGVVWLAYNEGVTRGRSDVPVRVATADTASSGSQIKVYQQQAGAEDEENTAPAPGKPQAAEPPARSEAQPAPKPEAKPAQPPVAAKPQPQPATAAASKPPAPLGPPAQLGLAHPAPEAPAPKPAAAKPVAASAAATGGSYLLQIGAYKSEDEAMGAWKTYRAKHGALLAGFTPDVQRADLGGKGVWYRLRVAAFADKDAATALCDKLKAENGNCFLAR